MIGQGKTIGLMLMLVAVVLTLAVGLYLFSGVMEGRLTTSSFLLGLVLVLVLAAPLFVGGIYLRAQGQSESLQYSQAAQQKKLLNIVRTHGKAEIPGLALELNLTREQVKDEVKRCLDTAAAGGRYILRTCGQVFDVAPGNFEALVETGREYGTF